MKAIFDVCQLYPIEAFPLQAVKAKVGRRSHNAGADILAYTEMSNQTASANPVSMMDASSGCRSTVQTAASQEQIVRQHDTVASREDQTPRDIRAIYRSVTTAFGPEPSLFVPTASPPPMDAPKTKATNGNRRALKTLAGAGLVGAFGLYPVYTLMQPSSVEAVLNARVVTLRSPISGRIETIQAVDDASIIPSGSKLLTVHSDRTDRGRLDELEGQQGRLANEQSAITAKVRHAEAERLQLQSVADRFQQGRVAQLSSRKTELKDEIAVAALRHEEAASTFQRFSLLAQNGSLSGVELDRAARQASITSLEEHSLQARMASIEQELRAAEAGIFIADGSNNDRPSSFQRAETARNEIATLMVQRDQATAEIERLATEIVSEAAQFARRSSATLSVPVDGRVWERLVSQGEEVSAGQALVRLVDCSTSVVTANVTERVYNRLAVGTHARFIPTDGDAELSGRIVNLTGLANAAANFAIEPSALSKGSYRIVVALNAPYTFCSIGRTGRVVFDEADPMAP